MLATTLRWYRGNRALHNLQQCLLDALTRHIAGDRRVVSLTRDLVDLINVDDAALRALNVVIGCLQQFQDDVLNILTDIAGFGQRGGIGHGKRHIKHPRECLGEQRLAAAGWADKQDV